MPHPPVPGASRLGFRCAKCGGILLHVASQRLGLVTVMPSLNRLPKPRCPSPLTKRECEGFYWSGLERAHIYHFVLIRTTLRGLAQPQAWSPAPSPGRAGMGW